jgi:hypothetical protein
MSAAPPTLLRRLLERWLPAEVRDGIVGDLDEVYRARRSRTGAARAAVWYAGQVLAISGRFTAERLRDGLRDAASIGPDLKLGLRMLVKYPMLTLIGGIAITVATAIGVGGSEFVHDLVSPELPFEDGDRIVRVYQIDVEAGTSAPASLYDLELWRKSLRSVEDLGAYTTMEQGFLSDRGEAGTVSLARDQRVRIPGDADPAAVGPLPHRRRRAHRSAAGGGARLRRLADAPRRRSGPDRADGAARRDAHHGGGRHARRVRLPPEPERVGAPPASIRRT